MRGPERTDHNAQVGRAAHQDLFTHVLLDHCGLFLVKQGRGRAAAKWWVMVFVCSASRVVHFELVPSHSTEETAAAVVRFACSHDVPREVFSDNAPEYTAAASALKDASQSFAALDASGRQGWGWLLWTHYPAHAPHFGGAVEAVIKLCKCALAMLAPAGELSDLEFVHALRIAW